mgnify:CR=1 FL=1|jgi:predicted DNA-binding transcriptional regulator
MTSVTVPLRDSESPSTFGWLQFEKASVKELQTLALEHPMAMGTLMFMINNMSRSNALMVSQQAISKQLKIAPRSVKGAVAVLLAHGFIQVVKVGTSNVYVVNTKVAWQGNRGARFAHFRADILAIESEQDSDAVDNQEPLKKVPVLMSGERLLVGNDEIDPPDQGEMCLP